jgi:hypothetical protein
MARSKNKTLKNLFLNRSLAWWILIGVILGGFLFRIYNLPHLFFYTMDEEVMNLIQRRIILGQHFPLIGSVSPLGTYLGPIFYYFGALILWISNLNPLGLGYFGCLLGTINIFLVYWVGKKLFTREVGLFAAIFYSFSFLMIIFDRRFWHLTPGPILSLLVLLSLFMIKKGNWKYIYLLIGALIFGWNTDYTNLILFLFTIVMWFILKLPIRKKEVGIAVLIFLISNLPLLVFDLRHNFLNTHNLVTYLTRHKAAQLQSDEGGAVVLPKDATQQTGAIQTAFLPVITFSRAIYTASDLNIPEQQTYCKAYINDRNQAQGILLPALAGLILVSFFVLLYYKRKDKNFLSYLMVGSFYLIFQVGILGYAVLFHGDIFEHYLSTLMPYFFIILGIELALLYQRFKYVAVLIILIFIGANINLILHADNPFGYDDKLMAAKYALSEVGSKEYSLDTLSSCYRWDGFYYPFRLLNSHPVKSYQDPNYSWLYDYQVADMHPSFVVVEVPKGKYEDQQFQQTYDRYKQWVIKRKQFDGLEVLILDNLKGDFH